MKPTEQLADFVARALAAGQGREQIAATLAEAGWQASEIRRAMGTWGDPVAGLPVPRPAAQVSAREAFIYALLFTGLAWLVWEINALGFTLIEMIWSEYPAEDYMMNYAARSIRWSMSVLIVVVPFFLWLNRLVNRRLKADPAGSRSAIRKWFGFVTLFFAVLGMIGDLIAVIYAVLNGDLTAEYMAKLALVMATSVLVFLYYWQDLRKSDEP